MVLALVVSTTASQASSLADALASMPQNSWQRINVNQYQDVFTPPAQRPTTSSPASNISAWSGAAWDSKRKNLLIWGGDIGNEQGNEVYLFDTTQGLWKRGSLPSQITFVNNITQTVDGHLNSPVSGESWDNVVYLPTLDRMAVIGVSREGITFRTPAGTPTGPYLWNPAKADPLKVSGLTGSHVNPTAYPGVVGGEMWQNRDNFPTDMYKARGGTTGYVNEAGNDVVYFSTNYDYLWRYTVRSLDPTQDTWKRIGVRTVSGRDGEGSGDVDPTRRIYVKTLRSTSFGFWDLDKAGDSGTNREIEVIPTVLSGTAPNFTYMGLRYDPTLKAFLLWSGDQEVWLLQPPANLDPDGNGIKDNAVGWTLRPLSPGGMGPTLPAGYTGVFGKWLYLPDERAYLGVIDPYSGDVFVYKPSYNTGPPVVDVSRLTLSASTVAGCKALTGTVELSSAAPQGGFDVTISDNLAAVSTPATVNVPAGELSTSFNITTDPVSSTASGQVTAASSNTAVSQSLTVRRIGLGSLTLTPNSLIGGNTVSGQASLECAAAPGPVTVTLTSGNSAVASPSPTTLTLQLGQQSASFSVSTSAVTVDTGVSISGTANGISKSASLTLRPANYLPSVTLTSPAEGTSFTLGQSIGLTATASDSDGSVNRVEFYDGLTKLGQDTTAPYGFTWSNASLGDHTLTAVAFDNAGASTTSSAVGIVVRASTANVAPTANLTTPSDGSSHLLGQSIGLSATASDSDGSVSRVEFYDGLTKLGQDTTAPYGFTWSNALLGSHMLTAIAFDNAGASTTSTAVMVTVIEDSGNGITVTLQDGLGGYTGTRDAYLYEAQTTINFGARENLSDQAPGTKRFRSMVKFAIFAAEGGPVPDGATITSATLSLYKYSAYNYTYRVRALLAGWVENQVTWNQRQIGVPWSGPGATALGSDLALAHDADASAAWEAGWMNVDITSGVQAIASGRANHGWVLEGVSGNSNIKNFRSSEYAADASLRPRLVIKYGAGGGGTNSPPSASLTSPAEGTSFTLGQSIGLTATASDSDGSVNRVEFYDGLTKLGQDTTAPYGFTWSNASLGDHTLTAVAFDNAGASTTSSAVGIVVRASTANVAPTANLTTPSDGSSHLLGQSIGLSATASDSDGSVSRVEFYDGLAKLGQDTTAPYGFTWSNALLGSHMLTAIAFDNAGASTTSTAVMVTVIEDSGNGITVTLQDGLGGYTGTRDAYLYEAQTTINFGARENLSDQAPGTKRFRSMVKFAIFAAEGGPVPDGATITSATLSLYKYSAYNYTYRVRALLAGWVENQVTWNQRQIGVPWSGPGATALGSDLALAHDADASAAWEAGWMNVDITSGVQAIASGRANHGWVLEGVSGNSNIKNFRSSEYAADASLRPRLVVTYH